MKSVLFINRVYPPDHGATGQLLAELAEGLAREGWRVSIVAAAGTAGASGKPRGVVSDLKSASNDAGVSIHRVRGLPFTRASTWQRALSYASLYPAMLWRVLRLPRHDVMVSLTDPPLQLTLGPLIKFFKRTRLVHWAQDIYPEVAEELGVLRKDGFAARILRRCSTWALRRHDAVVAVGRCMKKRLFARGIAEERLTVIPNWAVGEFFSSHPQPPTRATRPFTVLYSGNFGLAHPFEAIIEAVKILDGEGAAVRFIFAGDGAKLDVVRDELTRCRHVEFRPPVPLEDLFVSLAAADVHLASMSESLLGFVVPSKIYGALAAGRPCVFLGPRESEAAQLIEQSGRGVVLKARDSGRELAALLKRWASGDAEYFSLRAACEREARHAAGVPLNAFRGVLDKSFGK